MLDRLPYLAQAGVLSLLSPQDLGNCRSVSSAWRAAVTTSIDHLTVDGALGSPALSAVAEHLETLTVRVDRCGSIRCLSALLANTPIHVDTVLVRSRDSPFGVADLGDFWSWRRHPRHLHVSVSTTFFDAAAARRLRSLSATVAIGPLQLCSGLVSLHLTIGDTKWRRNVQTIGGLPALRDLGLTYRSFVVAGPSGLDVATLLGPLFLGGLTRFSLLGFKGVKGWGEILADCSSMRTFELKNPMWFRTSIDARLPSSLLVLDLDDPMAGATSHLQGLVELTLTDNSRSRALVAEDLAHLTSLVRLQLHGFRLIPHPSADLTLPHLRAVRLSVPLAMPVNAPYRTLDELAGFFRGCQALLKVSVCSSEIELLQHMVGTLTHLRMPAWPGWEGTLVHKEGGHELVIRHLQRCVELEGNLSQGP